MDPLDPKSKDTAARFQSAWQDFHRLAGHARNDKWDAVRDLLKRHNPFTIMKQHSFLADTFAYAAHAGQTDILKQMYAQGYAVSPETAGKILRNVLVGYQENLSETVSFLVREAKADTEDSLVFAASRGSAAALHALKTAGCDIVDKGGGGFFLALHGHNIEAMDYLHAAGANLYNFINATAQLPDNHEFKSEKGQETLAAFRRLVKKDEDMFRQKYEEWIKEGNPLSFSALRGERDGMPLMAAAARAGRLEDVVLALHQDKTAVLTHQDFLKEDNNGASVLSIMTLRGEVDKLFDARIWHRCPEEAVLLHQHLRKWKTADTTDIQVVLAEARQYNLRLQAQKNRPGLRPSPP